MQILAEKTLAAIGRMTVAALEVEHLLAWIGADRAGGDAAAVFVVPGEPLRAARGSVEFAGSGHREQLILMVEAVGGQLALSQSVLRRLWQDHTPADPAVFDEVAARLLAGRDRLQALVEAHVGAAGG
jgi:hypothetical protein